jgi:predicted RNase H-like nuclease (RuvC/YqgF family)
MRLSSLSDSELSKLPLEYQVEALRDTVKELAYTIATIEDKLEEFTNATKSIISEMDSEVLKVSNALEIEMYEHINTPHTILITSKKEGDKNESNIP